MADSWQQLTEILLDEHKEDLAKMLLEALNSEQWNMVEIEVNDHTIHRIYITRGIRLRKLINRSIETGKI
jgi:hypothetical protein